TVTRDSESELMSNDDPGEGLTARQRASRQQCAGAVLMIRPASFDYNPETAATNSMQQHGSGGGGGGGALGVCGGSAGTVGPWRGKGVWVSLAGEPPAPPRRDAVSPT